jgi:hypothetical protein
LNEGDLDWSSVDRAYRGYLDAWVRYRDDRRIAAAALRISASRRGGIG